MGEAARAGQRVADQGVVILDEPGGVVWVGEEGFVLLQVVGFSKECVEVGGVVEVAESLRERGGGQFDEGFGVGRSGAADRRHGDRIGTSEDSWGRDRPRAWSLEFVNRVAEAHVTDTQEIKDGPRFIVGDNRAEPSQLH